MTRGETQAFIRPGGRPGLGDRHFVPTAVLKAAMARAPEIDYQCFRADLEAYVDQDPTPRSWRED